MRRKAETMHSLLLSLLVVVNSAMVMAQTPHAGHRGAPPSQQQSDHAAAQHAAVNERGDKVMGFGHEQTMHHFRLQRDGGAIEVAANDANDATSRDQIRTHLRHIASKFSAGDFTAPMLIHGQNPPGVPVMKQRKDAIKYLFEETERGGRVRITTGDKRAVAAVHKFLRFQIIEHRTGDSLEVERNSSRT